MVVIYIWSLFICVLVDDITTTADGVDTYHLVKAAGRYQ